MKWAIEKLCSMNYIKAVIVDDEVTAIHNLKSLLDLFTTEVEVVGTASSVRDAVRLISKTDPDLVFLDIELEDGLGTEVLQTFAQRTFQPVFITAYDDYAIKAIRLNAQDYLLKPINPDELTNAVHKVKRHVLERRKLLIERGRFSVPTQNGSLFIDFEQVIRLASDNNYTRIVLESGQKVLVTKTLKKFEESLDPNTFLRVHAGHIVNFTKVTEYNKTDGGWLILTNGDEVPVSRKHKRSLEEALQQLLIRI